MMVQTLGDKAPLPRGPRSGSQGSLDQVLKAVFPSTLIQPHCALSAALAHEQDGQGCCHISWRGGGGGGSEY